MAAFATTLASLVGRIYYSTQSPAVFAGELGLIFPGPWRPPQWVGRKAGLSLTVTDPDTNAQTVYVFDAAMRAQHEQQAAVTLNPVQTGAAISDHAYVIPPRLTVEIAMSDSMQSFTLGQWSDGASRSVSAYSTLLAIQQRRLPVSVATRLRAYDNMIITSVQAEETVQTKHALKALVTFTQVLTASIEVTHSSINFDVNPANSALPQTTGQTIVGQTQPAAIPGNIQSQHFTAADSTVPGAGQWSSAIGGF
jgi:hypothetical protein